MKNIKRLMLLSLIFCAYQISAMEKKYPLHDAAKSGDLEQVKALIAGGADVNAKGEEDWTPLHTACNYDHLPVVQFLIKHGANVNAKNNMGNTPLHITAAFASTPIVEYLLANHANVNALNNGNCTPLHCAALNHKTATCGFLLNHGANILIRDKNGRTAADYASDNKALYKALLRSTILAKYESLEPQEECSICLEEFVPTSWIAVLECGHAFHDNCIKKAAETNDLCPICKQQTNNEETKLITEYKIRKSSSSSSSSNTQEKKQKPAVEEKQKEPADIEMKDKK